MSLTISEFQNATVHQTAEDLQGVSYAISGYCDPQFHRVLRAFVENFQTGTEVGAAVSVVH